MVEKVESDGNVRVIIYGHQDPVFDDVAVQRRAERQIYNKLFNSAGRTNLQYGFHDQRIFITFDDTIFKALF